MKKILITAAVLLVGCGNKPATDTTAQSAPSAVVDQSVSSTAPVVSQGGMQQQQAVQASPSQSQTTQAQYIDSAQEAPVEQLQPVVSVYVDPPLEQPAPVMVEWAPPPMLVDVPPPPPSEDDVWTGGYWVWEGNWVWAHGRWAPPPERGYHWNNPYYEHRGDGVVFVNGYWGAPGASFVVPPVNMTIALAAVAVGIIAGQRPEGPAGVFIPPPPGSHRGLIVPAPMGTAPAVVIGAPPIIRGGMHIVVNNNNMRTSNVTNVTNITNVTVVAPANATANGHAVSVSVPAQAHLAAAQRPIVNAAAPAPVSAKPIPAYVAGRSPVALPPPQIVHPAATPTANAQPAHVDQREHPVTAVPVPPAPSSKPALVPPPMRVDHAPPQARLEPHSEPQVAMPAPHNENLNHPQPNAASTVSAEKHNPTPMAEVKPVPMEKHNPVPIALPANTETHAPPPKAQIAPEPVKQVEPTPHRQAAPPPAPMPKASPIKPEPKETNPHEKEKHEAN